jgi:hypothetical protein
MNFRTAMNRRNELLVQLANSKNVTKDIDRQISDLESLIDSADNAVDDSADIQPTFMYGKW